MKDNVSIVIPVYNGALSIGNLVKDLIKCLASVELQIVLVNDSSPDNSHEVCSKLVDQHPEHVVYLNLAKNFGEHNAVMAGLSEATGDYVIIMDDDCQNPPQEVLKLVDEMKTGGYDVVYTFYKEKKHSFFRNLGSKFNNWVASFMLKKSPDLYLSSFKCINKFLVKEILKYSGPYPYIDGLILRSTSNIGQVEAVHMAREEGQSGYTLRKLIRLWLNMFVNFSMMPLRVSAILGFACSTLGGILSIWVAIEKIMYPMVPLKMKSILVVIFFFAGVQLLILGLLGEYLGRLFLSNNETPQYVIRSKHYGKQQAIISKH